MEYFKKLQELLKLEKETDRRSFEMLTATLSIQDRRENGMTWYPIAIKGTETGRGDYLTVELERTTHTDILHQLRSGMTAALFSNHDPREDRIEGTITHISGNRLKLSLRHDELPDWTRRGKLGVDAVFDENSYSEMESALKLAPQLAEKKEEGKLIRILTGQQEASSDDRIEIPVTTRLNEKQQEAVQMIIAAGDLAIVHGPPGTGKTTTLVEAIRLMLESSKEKLLVVAPSNAAVDLLSEKLFDKGLKVVRVGNPARVQEKQLNLTLDSRIAAHPQSKEIRRLKRQASEYRDLAHKYKRSFGPAEREQRKALFNEARQIAAEVEKTEQYIIDDVIAKADVITATLIGSNHYTIRKMNFHTVVIDEAGQSIEPACWVPILKAKKMVMAGDHFQLPPTVKSIEAAKEFNTTLMEKLVALYPDSVVLLEEQYRMHKIIMGFSSREFYGNRLKAHASVAQHVLFPGDKPFLFIDTAGCGFEEVREGNRLGNPEEAHFLLKQLERFALELTQHPVSSFPTTGIISPYRHQVELLKENLSGFPQLQEHSKDITINTIDSFQGQERDMIFISLARSNADAVIGFLSEIRRTNVAMTRARKKLVITGDSATLSQFPFYADLVAYAEANHSYISAWELMY